MKVSICIAVKNAESTIYDSLSSIQRQDFNDFEVIIVDDHSTDYTCNIILDLFCKVDNRFKLYTNITDVNNPYVDAHNKSYELATGEYLVRFDSDDIMFKNHISTFVEYLDNNPDVDMVCTIPIPMIKDENNIFKPYDFRFEREEMKTSLIEALSNLDNNDDINSNFGYYYTSNIFLWFNQSSCIRKSFLEKTNIKYESYCVGDHIFTWNALGNGAVLKRLPVNTVYYNCHIDSISNDSYFYKVTPKEEILLAKYKKEYFQREEKAIEIYPNGLTPSLMVQMFKNTENYFNNLIENNGRTKYTAINESIS